MGRQLLEIEWHPGATFGLEALDAVRDALDPLLGAGVLVNVRGKSEEQRILATLDKARTEKAEAEEALAAMEKKLREFAQGIESDVAERVSQVLE